MSGMVFPQSPGPDKAGRSSEPRSPVAGAKNGDSEFDSVSRQEQANAEKRLQARRQERSEQAERAAESRAQEAKEEQRQADAAARESRADEASETAVADDKAPAANGSQAEPGAETADSEADPGLAVDSALVDVDSDDTAVFTFADLRSMVMAGEGDAEDAPASVDRSLRRGNNSTQTAVLPGMTDGSVSKGLPGQNGAPPLTAVTVAAAIDPTVADLTTKAPQLSAAGAKAAEQAAVPLRGYATSIELPVGHAEWGDKLVGKLTWLTANNMSSAEIHLTPPDMGPMEVKVHLNREQQAAVTVHSANPVVRDQLELHSHRLRDMLNEQGIDLGRFEVADRGGQSGGEWSSQGEGGEAGEGGNGTSELARDEAGAEGALVEGGSVELAWKGELDLYA